MNLLISQFFGIGDVIFSMQLARNWIDEGHTVTWPVLPHFVDQLQRAYPFIEWVDYNTIKAPYDRRDEHDWNGYRYIPLRWANEILGHHYDKCMSDKYELFNLDFRDWRKGAMWNQDMWAEEKLAVLLNLPDEYNLINNIYGSESQLRASIKPENGLPNIYMRTHPDFSLFDWCGVIRNASEIHVVSSSILYILEMMDIKQPIHLYPRQGDPKFKQVDYLFSKTYILH